MSEKKSRKWGGVFIRGLVGFFPNFEANMEKEELSIRTYDEQGGNNDDGLMCGKTAQPPSNGGAYGVNGT